MVPTEHTHTHFYYQTPPPPQPHDSLDNSYTRGFKDAFCKAPKFVRGLFFFQASLKLLADEKSLKKHHESFELEEKKSEKWREHVSVANI